MAGQSHIHFLWTQEVFDETVKSLTSRFPKDSEKIKQLFDRLINHFFDSEIRGHERLIGTLGCKDKDDEHVLAGAIHGKANVLLTYNTRDFPQKLSRNLDVVHPDTFLISWLEANPEQGVLLLAKWLERFENPPIDARAAVDLMNKIDCPMLGIFIGRKAKSINAQVRSLRGPDSA